MLERARIELGVGEGVGLSKSDGRIVGDAVGDTVGDAVGITPELAASGVNAVANIPDKRNTLVPKTRINFLNIKTSLVNKS